MSTRHLTLRVDAGTFERLQAESRRTGRSRSDLAKTLIEEGLRMEAHPGIVFRPGPTGRRPGLSGGPDVWVVIRVFRDLRDADGDAIAQTADLTGLHPRQVETAVRYYADYQAEVDGWLERLDEEAQTAQAAWERRQKLLA